MNIEFSENIIGIDHVAVAVPDLQAAVTWARDFLGCSVVETRETTSEHSGMISAVLRLGGFNLVLVQGTGTNSQVTQFVEKHGPGVQHIALRVHDLKQAISTLTANGILFSTPCLDGELLSQIFTLRDPATGLMMELIERRNNYAGFSDENVQRLFDSLQENDLY